MVGYPTDGALLATPSTLYASSDMATWNKSRITLVFIAQLAHLGLAPMVRRGRCGVLLGRCIVFGLDGLMRLRYDRDVLHVIMGLFDLFLVIHEHQVSLSVSLVPIGIADVPHELHLLFTVLVGLSC